MLKIPNITFAQIVKNPVTLALIIFIVSAQYLLTNVLDQSKQNLADKDAQIKSLQEKEAYKDKIYTIIINEKDRRIDSLQGLIVSRTDNSYEELKKLLNIQGQKNTIIIKPKKR